MGKQTQIDEKVLNKEQQKAVRGIAGEVATETIGKEFIKNAPVIEKMITDKVTSASKTISDSSEGPSITDRVKGVGSRVMSMRPGRVVCDAADNIAHRGKRAMRASVNELRTTGVEIAKVGTSAAAGVGIFTLVKKLIPETNNPVLGTIRVAALFGGGLLGATTTYAGLDGLLANGIEGEVIE